MRTTLLSGTTPAEYFREQVEVAATRQKVALSALAEAYVVDLLARCISREALPAAEPGADEMPLALLYLRALRAASHERARLLRGTGDTALFVSGFFADALVEKIGDLAYYRMLGGDAYARLSRERSQSAEVFAELAQRFRELADVLSDVAEASRVASPQSVVRLYERWLQTRSRRAARRLAESGIAPAEAAEGRVH